ncbi:uncharacterized protein LOC126575064 isoform X2 [Anopheles aquasalis]|uniref:uncharacterized protein LOC126575064 isoform X2 n=1 Tax=Anopheles aquasalis TaxID=42839 RepID=UPI00215AEBD9|nr:uncharacterized protein LOC126575064 isoform X2 [Anopheles aquasalis]
MSPADLLLGTGSGLPGAGPATMKLSPGVGVTLLIGVAGSIFLASQTHRLLRSKLSQRRRASRKPDVAATECYMCNANIELERPDSFATCRGCERLVCRGENCCQWVDSIGIWECGGCQSNRVIQQKAGEWLLNQLTARLKHPGPVELKEGNLLGLGIDSDADTRSTVSVGSSSVSVNQRIKVREFIEELLSTMLHGSLDEVSVGQLMKNESYLPLWEGQQQHHSPSDQHFELKQLVQKILEEIAKLPELLNHSGLPLRPEEHLPYFDPKKYEQLLATAVLNKVVDDYRNPKNFVNVTTSGDVAGKVPGELDINHNKLPAGGAVVDDLCSLPTVAASQRSLLNEGSLRQMSVAANVAARDPSSREPDEDAEDDDYPAERRLSDTDESYLSDYIQRHKVPLPDLSDTTGSGSGAEDDDLQSLKSNATDGTWEENWLFRKRQLKTTESSIAMLVPSPTEEVKALIGDKNADEISDLSEAGSDCEAGYESDGKGQDSSPAGPSKESTSEAISSSSKANDDSLDEQLPPDSLVSVNSLPGNEALLSEAKNSQLLGEQSPSQTPGTGAGGEGFSLMDDLISIGPVMVASEKVETKNTALTNPFLDDPFEPNNNDITDDVKLLQRTNEQATSDLRSSHLEPTVNGSCNRKEIPIDRANPQQTPHPQHSNSLTPSNPVADSSVVNVAVVNEPSSVEDSASKQSSSGGGSNGREDSNSPECFPGMPQAAQLMLLNSLTPPSSPYPEVLSPHPITMTITDVFERMTNSPPLAMISEEAPPAAPVASLVDANPFQSIDEQESIQTVYTAQEGALSPSDSFQAEQDDSEYRTVSEATNNSLLTVESFDAEPNVQLVQQESTEQNAPAVQEALYVKDQEEVEFRATRQEEEEEAPVVDPFERDVDNSSRIQLHTADLVTFNNGPSPEGYPGVAAVTEQMEAYCEELKGHRPDVQSKEDEQHEQPQEADDPGWVLVDSSENDEAVSKLEDQPQQTVDGPTRAEAGHTEESEEAEALSRLQAPQQTTNDPWKVVDELQQPSDESFMLETEEKQQAANDPWQTVPHTGAIEDAEALTNLEEPSQAAEDPWMVVKEPQQAVNDPWNPETKETQQTDDDPWQAVPQPSHDGNSNSEEATLVLLDPFLTPFEAVNLRMAEYTDSMKGIEHVEEAIEMEEETCVLPQTSVEMDDASNRALCVASPELERHGVQIEQTPSTEDPPTEQLLLEPLEEETEEPLPSIGADEQLLASIESESKLEDTSLPFSDTDLHSLSSPPTSVTTFAINHHNCMPTNSITDQTPTQATICTTTTNTTTTTTTTSIDNTSTNHSNNDQQPDPEPEPELEPEPNTSSDADCSLIPAQIESAAEPSLVIMSNGGASTNGHHTATDEKQQQQQQQQQEPLDGEETLIPGSIAEREHLKWRNAKPIANNPYSPDALQRRLSEKSRPSSMIEIDRLVRKEAAPNGDDGMLRIGDDDPSSEPRTDAVSDRERSAKVCASSEQKKIGREYYINDPERLRAGGGGCVKQTLGSWTHAHHQQSHSTDDEKSLLLGRNPEDSGTADDGATIFAARPVHVTPADELRRGSKGNALSEAAREVFLLPLEPDTPVGGSLLSSASELSLITSPTASHARQEFDSLTYSEDSDVTRIYDLTTGEAKIIRTAATPQPAVPEEGDKILEILPQHPPASSPQHARAPVESSGRQPSQTPDSARDGNFLRSSHFVVKPLSPETIKFFAPKRKLSFTGSHSNLAASDIGAASRSTTPGMRDSTMHSSIQHTDCPVRSGATEYSIIKKDVIDVLPSVKELAKCYSGSTNDVSLMPPKPLYKPRDFLRQSSDVLNEETVVIDEKTGMPCSREKGQRQYCSTSSIAVRDEIREIRKINLEAYRQAASYYPMAPGHSITARSLSKQIREHKSNVTDDHKVVQHHDQADELLAGGDSSDCGAGGHISPERPSSPVLLLPGHLKSSIEFFESLKNRA